MRLSGGVGCDLCGMSMQAEFTYWSMDLRRSRMVGVHKPSVDEIRSSPADSSYDLCPACYDSLSARVVKNYRPTSMGVNCDLTSAGIVDDFWYCEFARVKVKFPLDKYGGKPSVSVEHRMLEIYICRAALEELVTKAGVIRKSAGQWSG